MKSDEGLFRKSIEALPIAIRQKETIKGVTIGTEETKVLQFADDTTAVLADTSSAERLFELLNKFKILSGLKIKGTVSRLCARASVICFFFKRR